MSYAENTSVPVERSRAEIETTLKRYGADKFVSGWDEKTAFVAFRAKDRFVRFVLPLPDAPDGLSLRIFRRDEVDALPADERQSIERAQQVVGHVQRRRSS